MGITSVFLANLSLSGLAWTIWNTSPSRGLKDTTLEKNLKEFLTSRGITGPFASVFGYWMIVAAVIGKFVYLAIWISISPLIGAFVYWIFKSMGWSVHYLVEIYKMLPQFIKNYFIYVNTEIMNTYMSWFSPVVETTKSYSKYILIWKVYWIFMT